MKRSLSLLLAMVMLVTTLPMGALATEAEEGAQADIVISEQLSQSTVTPTPNEESAEKETPTPKEEPIKKEDQATATPAVTPVAESVDSGAGEQIVPTPTATEPVATDEPKATQVPRATDVPLLVKHEDTSVKMLAAAAIASPSLEVARSDGKTAIYVIWSDKSNCGKYEIEYSTTSAFAAASTKKVTVSGATSKRITGLVCGTVYYIRVRADDGGSYSAWSKVLNTYPCALAPINFKATSASVTSVKLTWTASSEAVGYKIYRNNVLLTTITNKATIAYTDKALTSGASYTYRIHSYVTVSGATMESKDSEELNYIACPPKPTKVTAVSGGFNIVNLSWTAITGVTGYKLYRSVDNGKNFTLLATLAGAATNTYSDAKAYTGTVYKYYLVAYISDTVFSENSATVTGKALPPAVLNATAKSASDTSIKLTWTTNDEVSGYNIYVASSPTGTRTLVKNIEGSAIASFIHRNLTVGEPYYYFIHSYLSTGNGEIESPASAMLFAVPLPVAPQNFKATNRLYNSNNLSWTASNGADGYDIRRSTTSTTADFTLLKDVTAVAYNDNGLTCGTKYYYKVRAYVILDGVKYYGPYSTVATLAAKPVAPASVKIALASATSMKITWETVDKATGYYIYEIVNGGTKKKIATVAGGTKTTYTASKLTPGNKYAYGVAAYYTSGSKTVEGVQRNSSTLFLDMQAPTSLTAVTKDLKDLVFSWKAVAGATGYTITITCDEDSSYELVQSVTTPTYTLSNATKGYKYYFSIVPFSVIADDKIYGPSSATVATCMRPPEVKSLTAKSATKGITLTWTQVPQAVGYIVYRQDISTKAWIELTTLAANDILTYTDSVVNTPENYGKTFTYSVRSYINDLGRKAPSLKYTTATGSIQVPKTTVTLEARNKTTIRVKWTKVDDIYAYQILRATSETGPFTVIANASKSATYYDASGLVNGKKYYFIVRPYVKVDGTSVLAAKSNTASRVSSVVATTTTTVTAQTKRAIITWKAVADASGYNIYRATSANGTYTQVGTVSGKSTVTYTNTGLECGKTYYYRVAAYSTTSGKKYAGDRGPVASATTFVVVPGKPSGAVASSSSLKISWAAVKDVSGYRISMATSKDGPFNVLGSVSSGTLSYTAKNLPIDELRYFYVESYVTVGGKNVYSEPSPALITCAKTAAPTKLVVTAASKTAIAFSWKSVEKASGYIISYKKVGSSTEVEVATLIGSDITQYKVSGLSSDTPYFVCVRSFYQRDDGSILLGARSAVEQRTK